MRIAHVTATYLPHNTGTGNVAHRNAAELARRGHDVTVFTAQTKGTEKQESIEGVIAHRLPPLLRYGNAPVLPGLFSALRSFDIVHLHVPFYGGSEAVYLLKRLSGIPLVLTHHQDVHLSGLAGIINRCHDRLLGLRLMRAADRVCFTSMDYARSSVYSQLLTEPDANITALPNGVDPSRFAPAAPATNLWQQYAPDGQRIILFVGALDQAHYFKGVDVLLQAFSRMVTQEAVLLIVGKGDLQSVYRQQARELGVGDRVHFPGFIPDVDLPDYYHLADITVLPSTTAGEAFGLVLLESLASGTPVVASALPGVRTVVDHEQDGLLVPPNDVKKLRFALDHQLSLPQHQLVAMGEAGRNKVVQKYSWERIGDRLEQIYESVRRKDQARRVGERKMEPI